MLSTSNGNIRLGDEIIGNRLAKKTKDQYERKVKHFAAWLDKHHPDLLLDDQAETDQKLFLLEYLSKPIVTEFFGHICKKRDSNGQYIEPIQHQSFQSVSGYKSALKYHYRKFRTTFPIECEETIADFLGGYERKIAGLKQDGLMRLTEGKLPLTFEGYRFVTEKAWRWDSKDLELGVFAHTFLLFSWNLIARCVSVATLMFDHICWNGDAMTVVFPMHKGDQEGRNSSPKHVFANPYAPQLCPILSFAVYVFCTGFRRTGSKPSVFGNGFEEVETRFGNWLKSVCGANEQELFVMGMAIVDLGTHSFRKGVATFLAGIPGGPTPVSIYLRAGWSLGNVQKRYILDGQGGDQREV